MIAQAQFVAHDSPASTQDIQITVFDTPESPTLFNEDYTTLIKANNLLQVKQGWNMNSQQKCMQSINAQYAQLGKVQNTGEIVALYIEPQTLQSVTFANNVSACATGDIVLITQQAHRKNLQVTQTAQAVAQNPNILQVAQKAQRFLTSLPDVENVHKWERSSISMTKQYMREEMELHEVLKTLQLSDQANVDVVKNIQDRKDLVIYPLHQAKLVTFSPDQYNPKSVTQNVELKGAIIENMYHDSNTGKFNMYVSMEKTSVQADELSEAKKVARTKTASTTADDDGGR